MTTRNFTNLLSMEPSAEQGLFVPTAKRARLDDFAFRTNFHSFAIGGTENAAIPQPNWWRFGEMRRASISHFMDHESPTKLDTTIDKGIFDSNPLLEYNSMGVIAPPPLVAFTKEKEEVSDQSHQPVQAEIEVAKAVNDQLELEQSLEQSEKKRTTKGNNSASVRFRSHQAENWMEKYEELLDYRLRNGDCLVPNNYPQNPPLAEWVKRQRYQFKLKKQGHHSSMSDDRVAALEKLGFVWNSHDAVWETRYSELKQYKSIFGDTNVPSNYEENPKLSIWIKRQRRQYKFLNEGKPSTMTSYRVEKLREIDFSWSGRKPKKSQP